VTNRHESTQRDFYNLDTASFDMAYTRQLLPRTTLNIGLGLKGTDYDAPDPSVSLTTSRRDNQRLYSINLTQQLWNASSVTLGYQFKDIDSNLINYEYANERWSLTFNTIF
jgi:uncharacterized protein (PEP-CTERM system associated)